MSHRITVGAALVLVVLVACQRLKPSEDMLASARSHQAAGEGRAAVIELKNLLQHDPGHGAARRMLGELYLDQGDPQSAEKELRRALGLGQARQQVLPALVKSLLYQGSWQGVLDELRDEPVRAAVLAWRGHALLGLGKAEEAALLYTQALHQEPGLADAHLGQARLALARNDQAAAMAAAEHAVAANPDNIEALRFKAELQRAHGELDAALFGYQAILHRQPNNMQAHADIAILQLQAGHAELAHQQLDAARKLQPNSLVVVYTQGLLDLMEGRPKAALQQAQMVLRSAPDHLPSLLLAATVELALGAPAQARPYLLRYRQARPDEAYALRLLALCALREQHPQESLALLEPLLAKGNQEIDTLALAGEAAMLNGQFEQAAHWFGQASALAPESGSLLAASGISLLGQGDTARAIEALQQAAHKDGTPARAGALLVMSHLRLRQFDQALREVRRMETQADNPAVQNLKGGVLLARGDLDGARHAFAHALELEPANMAALDNLGELDLMEHKPAQARQRYQAALAQHRNELNVLMGLARLEGRLGNAGAAAGWLERVIALAPGHAPAAQMLVALYLRNGQADKALQLAQRLQTGGLDQAISLDLLAQAQAARGLQQDALDSLRKLAVLQPASAALQLRIARLELTLRQQAEALASARKALAIEPDNEDGQALVLALLLDRRDYDDALRLARSAQQRHPAAAFGHKLEGDVLLEQNKAAAALAKYQQAWTLQHSGPLLIALHRALLAAGMPQAATQQMRDWLAQHPADQPTRLYFASHLMSRNEFAAASGEYKQILERDPENVLALNDLAWAQLQLHDNTALPLAQHAYRLAPDNAAVADTLAWILAENGQPGRALPLFRQALARAPGAAEIRLHYAQALLRSGDKRGARGQCEQLLALRDFARRAEVEQLMAKL